MSIYCMWTGTCVQTNLATAEGNRESSASFTGFGCQRCEQLFIHQAQRLPSANVKAKINQLAMITEISGRPASVSEFTKLSHTSCPGTNCSIVWVSLSMAANYLLCFSQLSHVRICTWIGGMRPRKSFKMRFSEITSKVTFGPKCYWNFYFSPTCYNGSEQRH